MSFKIVFLCFVLQLVAGSIVKQIRNVEECYNKTTTARPQHAQFSTKTLYELVKGTLQDSQISDCQPAKIWLLVRHATVYPVDLNIDIEALKSLKESILDLDPHPLCEEDIDLLRTWELNENIAVQAGHLTKEGLSEMGALAADYKEAFQHLFESTDKVVFRHTTEQRNNESFSAFATALFDRGDLEGNFSHDQFMFEFYKHCAEWNDKNAKLSESQSVLSQFQESVLFKDTINEISVRLGLSDSENKWKTIKNVWDMCRIDKALVVENLSPWCAAFTPAHVNVLEYHEDIELYYKTGWGEEMNSRLACTTINDLINHLNTESSDETSPKAIVSFADATTVQLFITALGTHKDAVQASNDSIPDERMWKSSKMSPFASNIAVVKYDCPTAAKVKLFLNQKLLTPDREWCTEDGVCEFNEFIDHYSEYTSGDCKKYFCDSKTSSKSKIENGVGVFAVAISLILVYLH